MATLSSILVSGGTPPVNTIQQANVVGLTTADTASFDGLLLNANYKSTSTNPGWRDITSELQTRGGGSAPTLTSYRDGIYLYAFPSNANKEVYANFHIDHDYATGTTLFPHIHWTPNTTSTGAVVWAFEYTFAKGHQQVIAGSDYPATTTEKVTQTISSNSQYKHFVAELAIGVASTYIEPDGVLLVRVYRDTADAADTFPDSVFGITVDIHYQTDRYSTLNKAPNFYA